MIRKTCLALTFIGLLTLSACSPETCPGFEWAEVVKAFQ